MNTLPAFRYRSSSSSRSPNHADTDDDDDDSILFVDEEEAVTGSNRGVNKTDSYDSEKTGELTGSDMESTEQSALLVSRRGYGTDSQQQQQQERSNRAKSKWKRLASTVDDMLVFHESTGSSSIEEHRETVVNDLREGMEAFSLWQCLLAVGLYMAVAVAAFSFVFDRFTIIDACYFAVVTFTTIGYGDLVPDSAPARLFTSIFALTGVAFLGIALGVIGNNIIETQERAAEQARALTQLDTMQLFAPASQDEAGEEKIMATPTSKEPAVKSSSSSWHHFLLECSMVIVLISLFASLLTENPDSTTTPRWPSIIDAIYYAIISASTVGYGDMTPTTQRGRLMAIFAIPLAVGVMGHWLSFVATSVIRNRQDASIRRKMMQRELTLADLDVMDNNGDGRVSRMEFLEFMLVAMNKVDTETLSNLHEFFDTLDVDQTGVLSKNDLILRAKTKLRRTSQKLALSSYKQQLLRQGSARRRQQQRKSFWVRDD